MSTKPRTTHRRLRFTEIGVVLLFSATSQAAAQAHPDTLRVVTEPAVVSPVPVPVHELVPLAEEAALASTLKTSAAYVDGALALRHAFEPQNVPQDVRIMQNITSTALSEVKAPELPKSLADDSTGGRIGAVVSSSGDNVYVYSGLRGSSFFGRGDVSGFYMKGYGYIFTVHWPVGSAFALPRVVVTREGRSERVRSDDTRSKDYAAWADGYRRRLSDALRDVIAGYGSTLRRAQPGESITFLADFGGGDSASVTMTVKASALHGTDVEANRGAIQVSRGQDGMSPSLQKQLQIMSGIIDTSLHPGSSDRETYLSNFVGAYFGGRAEPQYVPGYGVFFRKTARLSTARAFVRMSTGSARAEVMDSTEATARKTYRAHLDTLRQKTAEILATYGPTLTALKDDDWVGIYYDVGSAAGLLSGGIDNYLVQARMRDIRQAAGQSNPAAWLDQRLVTNEKEE
ncbi:MAG: hypothetical protein LJF06_11145 [Gemmatimonadetes bacterium]|nr:hypothetical protein [Gemmatimonadota bacterium]